MTVLLFDQHHLLGFGAAIGGEAIEIETAGNGSVIFIGAIPGERAPANGLIVVHKGLDQLDRKSVV